MATLIDTAPLKRNAVDSVDYTLDGKYRVTVAARYDKYGHFSMYTVQSNDFLDQMCCAMGLTIKFGKTRASMTDRSCTLMTVQVCQRPAPCPLHVHFTYLS